MPFERLSQALQQEIAVIDGRGSSKRHELVIVDVVPPREGHGPRYLLEGQGATPFLKMNSNNYLGMSLRRYVIQAEEAAVGRFGCGPGAVRFISGTYEPHVALEARLAKFHGREAAMIFSSAYATVISTIVPLITADTALISDELNHNCIINAMRMARPKDKYVYKHNQVADLETALTKAAESGAKRAVVVTDGIFSMRGDHAPLVEIQAMVRKFDARFPENAVLVVDDSHGVGAFGATGRGTEEFTGCEPVDILVGTLGKAFGVNGGYVTGSRILVDYLRETSMMYIYSNPITPAEAAAAKEAVEVLDSPKGLGYLAHLREMTAKFEKGLIDLGFETIRGEHPVTPLVVRDTPKTQALVKHLFAHGILVTGLSYPVVPKGDEEIRFQVSADHTVKDIDTVLDALKSFAG
ncbi:MAG: aminotransferase class I/II-fold pyridoxal phosphate-dependent enzyme [Vicinamibacteria bacterium]|nr:aminotransferase class I/II-fold pyridoxal phosphate-dependent enzyme [Vicinamibacteria bacterium]